MSCYVADGVCVQSIEHPGCVWDAKFLENGDIVTACSDGIVRIWTTCHDKVADAVELDSFASQLSQYKCSRYYIHLCRFWNFFGFIWFQSYIVCCDFFKADDGIRYTFMSNDYLAFCSLSLALIIRWQRFILEKHICCGAFSFLISSFSPNTIFIGIRLCCCWFLLFQKRNSSVREMALLPNLLIYNLSRKIIGTRKLLFEFDHGLPFYFSFFFFFGYILT